MRFIQVQSLDSIVRKITCYSANAPSKPLLEQFLKVADRKKDEISRSDGIRSRKSSNEILAATLSILEDIKRSANSDSIELNNSVRSTMDDSQHLTLLVMSKFQEYLRTIGLDETNFTVATPLGEVGLDSLDMLKIAGILAETLGLALPSTILFDYPTIELLCAHLIATKELLETVQNATSVVSSRKLSLATRFGAVQSLPGKSGHRLSCASALTSSSLANSGLNIKSLALVDSTSCRNREDSLVFLRNQKFRERCRSVECAALALRKTTFTIGYNRSQKISDLRSISVQSSAIMLPVSKERFLCGTDKTLCALGLDAPQCIPLCRWGNFIGENLSQKTQKQWLPPFGSFIDSAYEFDALAFSIRDFEARYMDPKQRLLLQCCAEAIMDAANFRLPIKSAASRGNTKTSLLGLSEDCGVFIGSSYTEYLSICLEANNINAYLATGSSLSTLPGRISYVLGLTGPCTLLDTACSSSLVAMSLAQNAMRLNQCEDALVGAANLVLSPSTTALYSAASMLSADGRCKTFDASADGYGRSETVMMSYLRSGAPGIRETSQSPLNGNKDDIVLLGTSVNQDGRSSSFTAPNGPSQQLLVKSALFDAKVSPADVERTQLHGTGTSLGDPIEMSALMSVHSGNNGLLSSADRKKPMLLHAAKASLGHAEAAAGAVGLSAVLSTMRNFISTPQLHLRCLNPYIPGAASASGCSSKRGGKVAPKMNAFFISRTANSVPLVTVDLVGVAGISGFSFQGTNAHVIVQHSGGGSMNSNGHGIEWQWQAKQYSVTPLVYNIRFGALCHDEADRLKLDAIVEPSLITLCQVWPASDGPELPGVSSAVGAEIAKAIPELLADLFTNDAIFQISDYMSSKGILVGGESRVLESVIRCELNLLDGEFGAAPTSHNGCGYMSCFIGSMQRPMLLVHKYKLKPMYYASALFVNKIGGCSDDCPTAFACLPTDFRASSHKLCKIVEACNQVAHALVNNPVDKSKLCHCQFKILLTRRDRRSLELEHTLGMRSMDACYNSMVFISSIGAETCSTSPPVGNPGIRRVNPKRSGSHEYHLEWQIACPYKGMINSRVEWTRIVSILSITTAENEKLGRRALHLGISDQGLQRICAGLLQALQQSRSIQGEKIISHTANATIGGVANAIMKGAYNEGGFDQMESVLFDKSIPPVPGEKQGDVFGCQLSGGALVKPRLLKRLGPRVHGNSEFNVQFRASDANNFPWIISGGTGGIGTLLALWLTVSSVNRSLSSIFLLGRDGRIRHESKAWHSSVRAQYVVVQNVNVACSADASRKNAGRMNYVHAGGIMDNSSLIGQSVQHVRSNFAAKEIGMKRIQSFLSEGAPRLLVMFSSVAALMGPAGSATYGAANASLDSLSEELRLKGHNSFSIQWSAWSKIGMVADDHIVARNLKRIGVSSFLTPFSGLLTMSSVLVNSLASPVSTIAAIDFDFENTHQFNVLLEPIFEEILSAGTVDLPSADESKEI